MLELELSLHIPITFHMKSSAGVNFYRKETSNMHIHKDTAFLTCLHAIWYKIWGSHSDEDATVGVLGCNVM
jgi:hypothetical protein